jgi:predicted DNA binding protein
VIAARFRIALPEGSYIADISRSFPETTFRLLSGVRTGDSATELGEALTDDPEAVAAAFRDHDRVSGYETLQATDDRLLTRYETRDTGLYAFVEGTGFPPEFPVEVRDGAYEFDLTGTRAEFDRFSEALESAGLAYELLSKVDADREETLLTARQREVLAAALRAGYFEVPRECTLADVAAAVGVDKSTASGVLRRGEARLVAWYLTGAEERVE